MVLKTKFLKAANVCKIISVIGKLIDSERVNDGSL